MPSSLSQYKNRLPRYTLCPQDNTLIRVAGPKHAPWEEGTEIRNISLSGLAFTVPYELCPQVGEVIRVQFQIPGSTQTACMGLVVRIEPRGKSTMLVAIQFKDLEWSQRIVLLQGLARKLKEQHERQARRSWQEIRRSLQLVVLDKWPQILLMLGSLGLWITFIYAQTASRWATEGSDLVSAFFHYFF